MLPFTSFLSRGALPSLCFLLIAAALLPTRCPAWDEPLPDAKTLCAHWQRYFLAFENFHVDYTHLSEDGPFDTTADVSVTASMPRFTISTVTRSKTQKSRFDTFIAFDGKKYQYLNKDNRTMVYTNRAEQTNAIDVVDMPALMMFQPIVGENFRDGFPFTALRDNRTWEAVALSILPGSIRWENNLVVFEVLDTTVIAKSKMVTVTVSPSLGYLPVRWEYGKSFTQSHCIAANFIKVFPEKREAMYIPGSVSYSIFEYGSHGFKCYSGVTTTDEASLSFKRADAARDIYTIDQNSAVTIYDETTAKFLKVPPSQEKKWELKSNKGVWFVEIPLEEGKPQMMPNLPTLKNSVPDQKYIPPSLRLPFPK